MRVGERAGPVVVRLRVGVARVSRPYAVVGAEFKLEEMLRLRVRAERRIEAHPGLDPPGVLTDDHEARLQHDDRDGMVLVTRIDAHHIIGAQPLRPVIDAAGSYMEGVPSDFQKAAVAGGMDGGAARY